MKDLCFICGMSLCIITRPRWSPHLYYVQRPEIARITRARTDHGTLLVEYAVCWMVGAGRPGDRITPRLAALQT